MSKFDINIRAFIILYLRFICKMRFQNTPSHFFFRTSHPFLVRFIKTFLRRLSFLVFSEHYSNFSSKVTFLLRLQEDEKIN